MLIAHGREHVDANPHPPVYLQEITSEVFQDFLIPRTKYTELSPCQVELKAEKQKLNTDNRSMLIVAAYRALVMPVSCQHMSAVF